jgi:GNAT superfamily N-acetyltransferase
MYRPTGPLTIRNMTRDEVCTAVDWADKEGWNPGLRDAEAFYNAAPNGFYAGEIAGEMVATVSLVDYPGDLSFFGFNIVRKDMRGQGIGRRMVEHVLESARGRNIGADGVPNMLAHYQRMGFQPVYRSHRFRGWGGGDRDPVLILGAEVAFEDLTAYDSRIFSVPRKDFLKSFLFQEGTTVLVSLRNEGIAGYGAIRPCRSGHKIGPLFAENRRTAEKVLRGLISTIPGEKFLLDIPEFNHEGMALANILHLAEVFRTVRIYTKDPPAVQLDHVFGVTSFELG